MKFDKLIMPLIILVLTILLMKQCENKGGLSGTEIITTIDTLYKEGRIDTIFYPKVKVITKWLQPDVIHDTEYIKAPDGLIDTLSNYVTNYSDSAIDAEITSKVKGQLISTKISYVKKFPKFIYKTDTLIIDKQTTIKKEKWGLYAGGIIGGNEQAFTFQPSLLLKTNKSLQFSAGYEIVNKTYNFGVYAKIPNPLK